MGRTGSSRAQEWRPTKSRPEVRATVALPGDLTAPPSPTMLLARKAGRMGAGLREQIRNRAELPERRGSTGIETLRNRTNESVQAIYSPSGGHFVAYGGNSGGGRSGLPSGFGVGF